MEKAIKRFWPVFVIPTFAAFAIGFIWPFLQGLYLSFCRFITIDTAQWNGIQNYIYALTEESFLHSFWFTALFTVVSTICINVAAFAIARSCGRPLLYKMFPRPMIDKYDRWTGEGGRFARWFALLIFLPVAPDDYLCFLAGTTTIRWQLYTAIILLCKPFAIAAYSLGLTVLFQQVLGIWA